MKKKFSLFLLIILAVCLITACGKKKEDDEIEVIKKEELPTTEEPKTKELTCKTDLSAGMQGEATAAFSVSFIQDQKTYDFTSGTAKIIIDYTTNENYTEESLKETLPNMKTSFCSKDYFGDKTTRKCEMELEGKEIHITIDIDTDAFLTAAGVEKSQLNSQTLDGLRSSLENAEAFNYKCSIK